MAHKRQASKAVGNPEALLLEELTKVSELELEPEAAIEEVLLEDADLSGAQALGVRLAEVALRRVDLSETELRSLRLRDVLASTLNAANGTWRYAHIDRVTFEDSTLVGLDLASGELVNSTFLRCKLDLVNLRSSSIKDVVFSGCSLRGTDFYDATLSCVSFEGCELHEPDFSQATLQQVDLRTSSLTDIRGVSSLKGATIDPGQLIDLAQALAYELGIEVESLKPPPYSAAS